MLYYILIIDFILTLLKLIKKYNINIFVINKFSRKIILIFNKSIFIIKD